jgi:thiamine biosynthesis lipoprotein
MAEPHEALKPAPNQLTIVRSDSPIIQTLRHEAMATMFAVMIAEPDAVYARQAAAAAFAELDLIEGRLSRFVESSDVSRINRLVAGQATLVGLDTFECLTTALDIERLTGGAFDVTYASTSPAGRPRLRLDAQRHTVEVLASGVRVDLGGIGKGFALDRMAAILAEWEIGRALLCASSSTMLALEPPPGEPGWSVVLGGEHDGRYIKLAHAALSASGRSVKGDHIVDPHTRKPATAWHRIWAGAPTAAVSDALSTAFMVMTEEAIVAHCQRHPELTACGLKTSQEAIRAWVGFR